MDEEDAKSLLNVPRETLEAMERFEALLAEENSRQNLVSRASLDRVWVRHILDSAQLYRMAPGRHRSWLDIGTGAGFPGMVIALLRRSRVTMVESRRLRADFLDRAVRALSLDAEIICADLDAVEARPFDVISARAVAPLDRLFALGERFATPATCWLFPKGRSAKSELEAARASWQGDFRLEPSLTDADAGIIVAAQIRRKPEGSHAR